MIIEPIYPDAVAEYRKFLFAEIDAIGKRLLTSCRTEHELRAARDKYTVQTRPLYDELVRIESTTTRYYILAQ